jgi:hypothetical protein
MLKFHVDSKFYFIDTLEPNSSLADVVEEQMAA